VKKTLTSPKAPAAGRSSPGPFSETGRAAPDAGLPSIRQTVRQETHRENVHRQSQRPAEGSKPQRKRHS